MPNQYSYFLNPHAIPLLIAAFLPMTLGAIILFHNFKLPSNRYFFFVCTSASLWLGAAAVGAMATRPDIALTWFKIDNVGVAFIAPGFFGFAAAMTGSKLQKLTPLAFLIALTYGIAGFKYSYFVDEVEKFSWGYYPQWNTAHAPYFFIFWLGMILLGFFILTRSLKTADSLSFRNQIKFATIAFSIACLAAIDSIPAFGINVYPIGFIPVIISAALIYYAAVKYRLMNFDLPLRWGLAYGAIISLGGAVFLGFIYLASRFFESLANGLHYWIGVFAFILIFDPFRKRLSNFVDHYVFHCPDFQNIIGELNEILRSPENVEHIAADITDKVKEIWKVDHAGVVLWEGNSALFKPYPQQIFKKFEKEAEDFNLSSGDFLIRTLEAERRLFQYGIVTEEELELYNSRAFPGERATFTRIIRTMKKLGAAACVPIMIQEQLVGFIVLGHKQTGASYSHMDKKFLSQVGKLISEKINHLIYAPQTKPSAA